MPLEQIVKPFENFLPGNHLILGEAGSGKTRLIWSTLQDQNFIRDDSINIVLTDMEKRIWHNPTTNPITVINPYDTNLSWVAQPEKPGIFYCACEYAPRIITFLECLATWAIQNENRITNKVRLFVDFPVKYWSLPEFAEQLDRLRYISCSQSSEDGDPIEIWAVFGSFRKISPQAQNFFQNVNIMLLNPFPANWLNTVGSMLETKRQKFSHLLSGIDFSIREGYYYLPYTEEFLYLNKKPIDKIV